MDPIGLNYDVTYLPTNTPTNTPVTIVGCYTPTNTPPNIIGCRNLPTGRQLHVPLPRSGGLRGLRDRSVLRRRASDPRLVPMGPGDSDLPGDERPAPATQLPTCCPVARVMSLQGSHLWQSLTQPPAGARRSAFRLRATSSPPSASATTPARLAVGEKSVI